LVPVLRAPWPHPEEAPGPQRFQGPNFAGHWVQVNKTKQHAHLATANQKQILKKGQIFCYEVNWTQGRKYHLFMIPVIKSGMRHPAQARKKETLEH